MNDELLRATYDAWAESYDDGTNEMLACEQTTMVSILRQLDYSDVLDAGTGTGRYALALAQEGARVTAVDSNARMLSAASRTAVRHRLEIDFRLRDLRDECWPRAAFDLVVCAMTLAHVPDLLAPIAAFARGLRPGGHLVVSDLHPDLQADCGPGHFESVAGERRYFPQFHGDIEYYRTAVEAAGLDVVIYVDVPFKLPPEGIISGAFVLLARKPS